MPAFLRHQTKNSNWVPGGVLDQGHPLLRCDSVKVNLGTRLEMLTVHPNQAKVRDVWPNTWKHG